MISLPPRIPPNFVSLAIAHTTPPRTNHFNVIGVCVKVLEPVQVSTGQYKTSITLHDPSWPHGAGMEFALFERQRDLLPVIGDLGDVVIFRNMKTWDRKGYVHGISNTTTTWVVLPGQDLVNVSSSNDLIGKANWKGKAQNSAGQYPKGAQAALPNDAELAYTKWILEKEDPSTWPTVEGRTKAEIEDTIVSNGGQAPAPAKSRLRTLADLEVPDQSLGDKAYYFADIVGEVRKIYTNDFVTELKVTDYTSNEMLYNYQPENFSKGRDGDPHGYIQESKGWPGPWGRMTINVRCRDLQRQIAINKVNLGDVVSVRNVQIKLDSDKRKLEANCRDDPRYHGKEMITVLRPKDQDGTRLEVLQRKMKYQEQAEKDGIDFHQHPEQIRQKKSRSGEELQEQPLSKNARKKQKKAKQKTDDAIAKQKKDNTNAKKNGAKQQEEGQNKPNEIVKVKNYEGLSYRSIVDILDPAILERTSPQSNLFHVPFQNSTYKSRIRVVDFFPDDIADFAAPRRIFEYTGLDGYESPDEDSNPILQLDGPDINWEWRFILLVEDARPQTTSKTPIQMELLVAEMDGDWLLDMEACNLRDPGNATALALLEQKLFHLWGDLLEQKQEDHESNKENQDDGNSKAKPKARAFDCLIKEYGVPVRGSAKEDMLYDRMFRMFGTNISSEKHDFKDDT
jgi:protection of telomeres protein 1